MKTTAEGAKTLWNRYKYAILVVVLGALLLLWPAGRQAAEEAIPFGKTASPPETEDLASKLEEALGMVSGVGQVRVLLTLESDGELQLAQDTEFSYSGSAAAPEDYSRRSTTVLADGASGDAPIPVRQIYPTYRGALVVCQGGDRAEVRLSVTQAVAAVTGLSTDRVTVVKWQ